MALTTYKFSSSVNMALCHSSLHYGPWTGVKGHGPLSTLDPTKWPSVLAGSLCMAQCPFHPGTQLSLWPMDRAYEEPWTTEHFGPHHMARHHTFMACEPTLRSGAPGPWTTGHSRPRNGPHVMQVVLAWPCVSCLTGHITGPRTWPEKKWQSWFCHDSPPTLSDLSVRWQMKFGLI